MLAEATAHILRYMAVLLAGLSGWERLLAGLYIQAELLGGPLTGWGCWLCPGQMGPPAGFRNHLWQGEAAGCAPWQRGAAGWTPRMGGAAAWALRLLLVGWGLRLCLLTRWGPRLDSTLRGGGPRLGFAVGQVIGCALLLDKVSGQVHWLGEAVSCSWMSYRLCFSDGQGHYPGSLSRWGCRLCSATGQGQWLGSPPGQGHRLCQQLGRALGWALLQTRAGGCFHSCHRGFLVRQDSRLCSAVRQDCERTSPPA